MCTANYKFIQIYGATQQPETKEYMIVMQYANNGSLPSYLDQNINKLTWTMKLQYLRYIAVDLYRIHSGRLIHCDLHGGNIVLHDKRNDGQSTEPRVCDLGLSKSVDSCQSTTTSTIQGVLPYIAPEVLHTRKFTQASDIYSFGIIMHQIASGEPPFRNMSSDDMHLAMRICNGLRPEMPDSAPEEYKELAERCCDADPNKRPDGEELCNIIFDLNEEIDKDESAQIVWNSIYCNTNVRPLLRIEKESKYSSRLLPTEDLPKPRNSCDVAGMNSE